ncbi:IclR family transcriptional regulator [Ensifer sp. SSB1]|uniref:IclR family transcriptional regulator n=1 Tax=Ensifer sp. SSB1 TaxID=2795385 RepID=UPI001A40801B|nr:IclR family transcriptional regulator [Ensifer sp. SSB1]MBK5568123.1 IclR family transcriptional regulator [Ensifer sp. SSB1]
MSESENAGSSSLAKAIHILKDLAENASEGVRVIDLARRLNLTQPSAHRLLKSLIAEGLVEQMPEGKSYRLSLEFFSIASQARRREGILDIARPSLLRLSATFNDTVFLLVRSNFDAICLDRVEGPFPIRSFTGDIGGKVPLGIGQGSIAILAHLPEEEREAIIKFNMPRIMDRAAIDEVDLRIKIEEVRRIGAAQMNFEMIEGMAGLGVPVLDRNGIAVASLSIGTLASRLTETRSGTITDLLKAEAQAISSKLNPFDPTLRYPASALRAAQKS